MKKNKKKILSLILIAVMMFSLISCGDPGSSNGNRDTNFNGSTGSGTSGEMDGNGTGDIVLGFIGSMTGEDEIYGYVAWGAIKMAVDRINEAGGVAGHTIVLKQYDDRADGVEAVNCCRKAILDDHCVAIITASSSAGLISINSVLEEYKVPCIAYAIGSELITRTESGETRPYMFRVNTTASQCTTVIGQYAADVMGLKTAAIFYDISRTDGADGVTYFTNGFEEKGGQIVQVESYRSGDVDFRAQISSFKSKGGFEAIYSAAKYTELGLVANQLKELGVETQLIGDRSWMMLDLFKVAGDNLEGAVFPSDIDFNDAKFSDFNKEFEELWDVHPGVAVGTDAYCIQDACMILWNAIEKVAEAGDAITGENIRDSIENNSQKVDCFTDTISIDPETHNVRRSMGIFEIQSQDFVRIDSYDITFG